MTRQALRSRLDHFLQSYRPLPGGKKTEAIIFERVYAAGMTPDDPQAIVIAQDTIAEMRGRLFLRRMSELEDAEIKRAKEISSIVRNDWLKAQARLGTDVRDRIAAEASAAFKAAIPRLVGSLRWRAAAQLLLIVCVVATLPALVAYQLGRMNTAHIAQAYADVATSSDAETWLMLQRINPGVDQWIARECKPGGARFIQSEEGQVGCDIPLRIAPAHLPQPHAHSPSPWKRLKAAFARAMPAWLL